MAPRKRFTPVDLYKDPVFGKPLSVKAPKTRRTSATTPQLSTIGHLFDKAAGPLADYIKGERDRDDRANMQKALMAFRSGLPGQKEYVTDKNYSDMSPEERRLAQQGVREKYAEPAYEAVIGGPMDQDETDQDNENMALDAYYNAMPDKDDRGHFTQGKRLEGVEAAIAVAGDEPGPVTQRMLNTLMLSGMDQRRAKEAAELKRSQELFDVTADRTFRAGESALTRTAADARHKAATRQRLEYFGATQKAAQERILDERKYKRDEKKAADAIVKAEAKKKEQLQFESIAITQHIMAKSLDGAFAALDAAKEDRLSLGASGTLSQIPALLSGSYAGKLRSHILSLKSPIVMEGIEKLRASSAAGATGFGAMNKEELGILIYRLGALDPDSTDPVILRATLEGIRKQVEVVKKDMLAKVPHDKLRAIGLGHWLPKRKALTATEAAAELKKRAKAAELKRRGKSP